MIRNEGIAGLYAGFFANLVRILPAAITTFVVYEKASHYLQNNSKYINSK